MTTTAKSVGKSDIDDLLYTLIASRQYDYCYVLHHVNLKAVMEPFGFCNGYPVRAAATYDTVSGQLGILLYWPMLSRLSLGTRLEVLQHEVLHIIEGHMSSFGQSLIEKYGQTVANYAMDLVVNQKYARPNSAADGLTWIQLKDFPGFPANAGSLEYAERIQDLVDKGKLELPECSSDGTDLLAGTAGQPGDKFTGRGVKGLVTEFLQFQGADGAMIDEQVKTIITSVTEALQLHGNAAHRFRGLQGSDYEDFMQASKRKAVVPWSQYLRVIETRSRQQIRVNSRRRPSRRHPAYFGHTWRGGLDVVFLVDTSGSMGAEELKLVDPELKGLHSRGANITVMHADTGVAKVHPYQPSVSLQTFFGRGGTDYSIALEQIRQLSPRPSYVIGYTDGFGSIGAYKSIIIEERGQDWWEGYIASHPEKSPDGIPTIWLLPEDCMSPDDFTGNVCPWGKTIIVKRDRA